MRIVVSFTFQRVKKVNVKGLGDGDRVFFFFLVKRKCIKKNKSLQTYECKRPLKYL